ncbi:acyltransferase [bacterium]|nr:acyltransferase [bacterium]
MELSLISKHRTALMGIAALMILICHSAGKVIMPSHLGYAISYLNIGVDIFLFLSGMGIYYSLNKFKELGQNFSKQALSWYLKRYLRILVPYMLIVIPLCTVSMSVEGENWKEILLYISTISFWTEHTGFWFIALILPLYFISPLLFFLLTKNGRLKGVVIIAICTTISLTPINSTNIWGGGVTKYSIYNY